jgi:hypothetical protein
MQGGQSLASLISGTGAQQANALLSGLGAQANLTQATLPMYQAPVQYAGQGTAAIANAANQALSNMLFLGASQGMFGGSPAEYRL